ncbi:MAG: hypothetical protein WKG00_10245 [Polyangiaceae bacterium]
MSRASCACAPRIVSALALATALCSPAVARPRAPTSRPTAPRRRARAPAAPGAAALYAEASRLLQEGNAAEALRAARASLERLDSPNTSLLAAHALRLLGRRVEAVSTYERVLVQATAQVRAGETRFVPTLADAGRWKALLESELGRLRVDIAGAPEGVRVSLDGAPLEVTRDTSGAARAQAWHEPGRGHVRVVAAREDRLIDTTFSAAAVSAVHVDLRAPPMAAAPPAAPPADGVRTAAWVSFGVGAAGVITFAVFGAMAASTWDDLEACTPGCAQSRRDEVDRGRRDQTIANVSLVTAGAAVLVGLGLLGASTLRASPGGAAAGAARTAPGSARITVF